MELDSGTFSRRPDEDQRGVVGWRKRRDMSFASCEIRDGCSRSFFKPPGSIIRFNSAMECNSMRLGDFKDFGTVFIGWLIGVANSREMERKTGHCPPTPSPSSPREDLLIEPKLAQR